MGLGFFGVNQDGEVNGFNNRDKVAGRGGDDFADALAKSGCATAGAMSFVFCTLGFLVLCLINLTKLCESNDGPDAECQPFKN